MKLPLKTIAQGSSLLHNRGRPLDVLIIGAGWAGLGAAKWLKSQDIHNFLVVEGRDYIGGRSRTVTLNDGITRAEVGSQWVQGAKKSNPIYQATLNSGVNYSRCSEDWSNAVYFSDDEQNMNEMYRLTEEKHDQLVQEFFEGPQGFFEYQASRQDEGENDRSLREIANQYVASKGMTNFERRAFEWMLDSFISEEYAASPEDLSHWWWDSDDELQGGDVYLAQNEESGFTGVVEHYAESVIDNICLGGKVLTVDWTDTPVSVKVVEPGAQNRETTILAKNVMVTVPLGCLKEGTIDFAPVLPPEKLEAIDKLGMGLLNKCTMLWSETDQLPWPNDKEWIEKIAPERLQQGRWTEFYSPTPLNGRPILYAYCSGRVAHLVEDDDLSDDQIKAEVMRVLSTMFGDVPEPQQVLVSRWGKDEFSRGSYSFHKVGSSPNHRRALARPLNNRLFFAGEATCVENFATAQGALQSGIKVGKQIRLALKNKGKR